MGEYRSRNIPIRCTDSIIDELEGVQPLTQVGVFYTNEERGVVFANKESLRLVQCEGFEIGHPLYEVIGVQPEDIDHLFAVREEGDRSHLFLMIKEIGYSHRLLLCQGIPAFDESGGFIGVNIVLNTLTLSHLTHPPLAQCLVKASPDEPPEGTS